MKLTLDKINHKMINDDLEGVETNLPEDIYHACNAIGHSSLCKLGRSPAHYKVSLNSKFTSKAMTMGSAVHCAILEEDLFDDKFFVKRKIDKPSKGELTLEKPIKPATKLSKPSKPSMPVSINKRTKEGKAEFKKWEESWIESYTDEMKVYAKSFGELESKKKDYEIALEEYKKEKSEIDEKYMCDLIDFDEEKAKQELIAESKIALSEDEFEQCFGLMKKVKEDPYLNNFFRDGVAEASAFAKDIETDLWLKCRVDYFLPKKNVIIDLKTTDNASPEVFPKSIAKYNYHVQAAYYLDIWEKASGLRPKAFIFVVVEKLPPYGVKSYMIGADSIEVGRKQYRKYLNKFKECQQLESFPDYDRTIDKIELPQWALNGVD